MLLGGISLIAAGFAAAQEEAAQPQAAPSAETLISSASGEETGDTAASGLYHSGELLAPQVRNEVSPKKAAAPLPAGKPQTADKAEIKTAAPRQADRKPVVETKPAALSYKVKPGDTLLEIAAAHKVSLRAIREANGLDPRGTIFSGKLLRLPGAQRLPQPKLEKAREASTPVKKETSAPKSAAIAAAEEAPQKSGELPSVSFFEPTAKESAGAGLVSKDLQQPAALAPAEETAPLSGKMGNGPNLLTTSGMLLGLVLKLALVLALAYMGTLALRRVTAGRVISSGSESPLRVVKTVTLGPNRWLHIISLGEQAYLIGSTPQQTSLLAEIKDDKVIAELSQPRGRESSFAGCLSRMLTKERDAGTGAGLAGASAFLAERISDLRRLSSTGRRLGGA